MKIPVKHVEPIDSIFIKLEDGTSLHWFNTQLLTNDLKEKDLKIEWIDGIPYRVSYIEPVNPNLSQGGKER